MLDDPEVLRLRRLQDGVVARRQLRELGAEDHDLERWIRRRDLVVKHRGVYLDHTGPMTQRQREWVAVLAHWPAALTGPSVLPGSSPNLVHIAIDARRTVHPMPGVVLHRMARLDERVQWNRTPPRVGVDHAALDVAAAHLARDDIARAFVVLAEVCGGRATTPQRLLAALDARHRQPDRRLLRGLLEDLASGTSSILEHGYLDRVERPHGLPRGRRQHRVRVDGRTRYTDVDYDEYDVVVEIDGRAGHDSSGARDRDADRDLDTLLERDAVTPRVTWGLVFTHGCRTARKIGRLLNQRGWEGSVVPCPRCSASSTDADARSA